MVNETNAREGKINWRPFWAFIWIMAAAFVVTILLSASSADDDEVELSDPRVGAVMDGLDDIAQRIRETGSDAGVAIQNGDEAAAQEAVDKAEIIFEESIPLIESLQGLELEDWEISELQEAARKAEEELKDAREWVSE